MAENEDDETETKKVSDEGLVEAPPSEIFDSEYTVEASDGQEHQAAPDILQSSEESEKHDAGDEADSAPLEFGTDPTTEEVSESLDVNEGHLAPDATEGADDTEYPHGPEDDDEDFGEPLPEELDGIVEASELQHQVSQESHDDALEEVNETVDESEAPALPVQADDECECHNTCHLKQLPDANLTAPDPHTAHSFGSAGDLDPRESVDHLDTTSAAADAEPVPDVGASEPNAEPEEFDNFEGEQNASPRPHRY